MASDKLGNYEDGYPELQALAYELRDLTERITATLKANDFIPFEHMATGAEFLEWSHATQMLLAGFAIPGKQIRERMAIK